MKIFPFCFLFVALFCGYGKKKSSERQRNFPSDSISQKLFVKNRYLYSDYFLSELYGDSERDSLCIYLKVLGDNVIYNSDTLKFPEQIMIGKIYNLYGQKDGETHRLLLTRVNKTDLKYYYFINNKPKFKYADYIFTFDLWHSLVKSRSYDDMDYGQDYLKYVIPNMEDTNFYLFLKKDKHNKLQAVFREYCWLFKPPYIDDSPIMIER